VVKIVIEFFKINVLVTMLAMSGPVFASELPESDAAELQTSVGRFLNERLRVPKSWVQYAGSFWGYQYKTRAERQKIAQDDLWEGLLTHNLKLIAMALQRGALPDLPCNDPYVNSKIAASNWTPLQYAQSLDDHGKKAWELLNGSQVSSARKQPSTPRPNHFLSCL
jgi:hypothetical protein